MKKKLLILFFIFLNISLFATREQALYRFDDMEYQEVVILCSKARIAPPLVSPITAIELSQKLDMITEASLKKEVLLLQQRLLNKNVIYEDDIVSADGDLSFSVAGYAFDGSILESEFFIPYRDRLPLVSLYAETSIVDNAYLYFEFMIKEPKSDDDKIRGNVYTNTYPFVSFDGKVKFLDSNYMSQAFTPFLVGGSCGNYFFNFQIGRNRLAYGLGKTGNLTIADNFSMQEYLMYSFHTNHFKYSLNLTHFDQQSGSMKFNTFSLSGKHQVRVMHRAEVTFFPCVTVALNNGAIFQTDSALDWRFFVPGMMVHSYNNFLGIEPLMPGDEANNIFSIDFSWAFAKNYLLHGQIVLDQFQLYYEDQDALPNALGVLFNIQNTSTIGKGVLSSYFETAYTMPNLYLNKKRNSDNSLNYNYDHILGYGMSQNSQEINYSGYKFGPDSLVLGLGSKYNFKNHSIFGNIIYRLHGIHGIKYYEGQIDVIDANAKGVFEHSLLTTIGVDYDYSDILKVSLLCSNNFYWNYHNEKEKYYYIPGCSVAVKYTVF